MSKITYDLIVLGGGRATTLAIEAAKAGQSVALIEPLRLGGTCPNRGCVPSKLLIGYAHAADAVREAGRHHVQAEITAIDRQQIIDDVNEWIEGVDPRYASRMPDGLDLYRGYGRFISNHEIVVNEVQLSSARIVIATGARSRAAQFSNVPAWTSDDLFPFKHKIPQSIAIVGGGFIACELAGFFQGIGVETTLLVRGKALLPVEDELISRVFTEQFGRKVKVKFGTVVDEVEHSAEGGFQIKLSDGEQLDADALLYATGRIPNSDKLGLENTDIEMNSRGFIERGEDFQTAVEGVYAIGDVAGKYQLQHASSLEVKVLTDRLLYHGLGDVKGPRYMPHAVFTDPEIASVGLTERELVNSDDFVVVTENWLSSARAMSWRLDYPLTKLIVKKDDYSIHGCHMIGPESSTMIHQVLMLMELDNDVRKIPQMVHIHPSLSESLIAVANKAIAEIDG